MKPSPEPNRKPITAKELASLDAIEAHNLKKSFRHAYDVESSIERQAWRKTGPRAFLPRRMGGINP